MIEPKICLGVWVNPYKVVFYMWMGNSNSGKYIGRLSDQTEYLNQSSFGKYPGRLWDLFPFFFKYLTTIHVWNKKNNRCDMDLFDWYNWNIVESSGKHHNLNPQIGHKSYEAGGYDSPSINISFLNYRYMSFRLILFHFHGTFNYFLLHKCEVSIKFNQGKQYCTVIKVYHKRSVYIYNSPNW